MDGPTLIPMLDPKGQARMIPMDQVDAAKKAGGKVARKFEDPGGTNRWIPAEMTDAAVKAGGKPVPFGIDDASPKGGALERFVSSFVEPIADTAKSLVPHSAKDLYERVNPITSINKSIVQPAIEQGKKTAAEFKQSAPLSLHPTAEQLEHRQKTLGHGLATVVPVVGPWAANVAEKAGTQVGTGDYAGGAGTVAGNAALALAPKVVGKAGRLGLKAGESMVRNVTETTPRDVAGVVKETSAENEVKTDKAAKKTEEQRAKVAEKNDAERERVKAKNADNAQKRQVVLKKHFDALQKGKGEPGTSLESGRPRTTAELQSHREALTRGVEQLDTPFKEDLAALREKVNGQAHEMYGELDTALNDEEANPHFLGDAIEQASEKIKGSNTDPTILKDMEKRINGSDALTYEDLQGYYSELGKELSKGTLAGDVYYAYNTLQDLVGDEMQRIAKSKDAQLAASGEPPQNLSAKLTNARNFYRQMKQTFYDPKSPVTRAIRATERGKSIGAFQGADQSGIEALAQYDSELAQRANTLRGYQAEAKGIPKAKPTTATRTPTLSAPPPPVEPNVTPQPPPVQSETVTQTPESLTAAKAENVTKAAEAMRHSKSPLVSAVAGYGTIKALLVRNLATAGLDITARLLYGAAKPAIANILERPKVVAELSKFTEKDAAAIAKLPARQRAAFADTMGKVASEAEKKGVTVSPALVGAIAAAGQQDDDQDQISEPPKP